ncbi:hypothetical protein Tco_1223833 [Tanacetum coccineum]
MTLMRTSSTPIETTKALLKDEEAEDVDVHLYRSMIGSLIVLTAYRLNIIYLKGQPKLGLWYPRDSPFDLEAFSDSNYARASLDMKSTTRGCQFLGKRLISWQCKKHTIVANSTTKAKYVADANCCGHVLWIQNQMLDYGFNFINTKIHIVNESTIYIVKNLVFHAKTKHIEIRHHFIIDSYEKRLIQVIKIHTDHNVADLLTKAFDVSCISNEFGVKTGGCKVNAAREIRRESDFHEIVDFLTASSVHYALTITFAEPFNDVYQTPAHTKKVFTNMKRKGKDFSGRVTPLFASMLAPPVVEGKGSGVVRATTTAASLDAAHASSNITKTHSTVMSNDPLSQEIGSGDRPRVLALETSRTAQDLVIQKLKKKVKRLEKKQKTRTPGMKLFKIGTSNRKSLDKEYVSKQGRKNDKTKPMFDDSDFVKLDVDNAMENVEGDAETQRRNTAEQITTAEDTVNTASIDVSVAGPSNVSTADPYISTTGDIFEDEMMTIADILVAIRSTRPRTTSMIIHDVEEESRRLTPALTVQPSSKDKGKALMVEPDKPPKNLRKAQIQMDEELAIRLNKEEKAELEKNAKRKSYTRRSI